MDTHVTVSNGDPADEIDQYAESEDVDLITLGATGRGGFRRFLLGSVADSVIRTASIPVLTARPTNGNETRID